MDLSKLSLFSFPLIFGVFFVLFSLKRHTRPTSTPLVDQRSTTGYIHSIRKNCFLHFMTHLFTLLYIIFPLTYHTGVTYTHTTFIFVLDFPNEFIVSKFFIYSFKFIKKNLIFFNIFYTAETELKHMYLRKAHNKAFIVSFKKARLNKLLFTITRN